MTTLACALTQLNKLVTLTFVLQMCHDLLTRGHCVDTDKVGVTHNTKHLGRYTVFITPFRNIPLIFQNKHTFFWLFCSSIDWKPQCLILLQTRHVQTERCINPDIRVINPFVQLRTLTALFLARQQLGHRQDSMLNNLGEPQNVAWKT